MIVGIFWHDKRYGTNLFGGLGCHVFLSTVRQAFGVLISPLSMDSLYMECCFAAFSTDHGLKTPLIKE
jgi:hypothetical protein